MLRPTLAPSHHATLPVDALKPLTGDADHWMSWKFDKISSPVRDETSKNMSIRGAATWQRTSGFLAPSTTINTDIYFAAEMEGGGGGELDEPAKLDIASICGAALQGRGGE